MQIQQTAFERCLAKVESRFRRIEGLLGDARLFASGGDMENAYVSALLIAEESERLTLFARVLPAYTGHPLAGSTVEATIAETVLAKIGFTREGWFAAYIPALMPKKSKGSPEYIRSILYLAMRRFFAGKEPVCYPNCVLIFRHVYDRSRPERLYRDHDNIELNAVADVIALYVLKDDAPLRCSHYYCSAAGSEDRTEVYVVPQDEFIRWLDDFEDIADRGVILYEKRP